MAALEVLAPDHYVGATEAVGLVVDAVETMLAAGRAYRVPGGDGEPDGDVYFDVRAAQSATDWRLGQVSAMGLDEMAAVFPERGGDPDRPGKRDPLDPLLWRVHREGEPAWDGRSLGSGRPGWHIECSVISRAHLPAPFTVQGGGSDLRFPHHEFSAAHATAVDGLPLAHTYAHTGMVALDGEKMSKSLGNLELVSRLRARGVEPVAVRAAILAHHYRSDWEWSEQVLADAQARVARWRAALDGPHAAAGVAVLDAVHAALSDDLDAPARWRPSTHGRPAPCRAWPRPPPTRCRWSTSWRRCWVCACADPAGRGRASASAAPAQIALELPRDRLARGLRQLLGVLGLLELPDVGGDVGVLGGQLVHAALPGPRVVLEPARGHAHVQQVLDRLDQPEQRLGEGAWAT